MPNDGACISELQRLSAAETPAAPFLSVVIPAYNEALRIGKSLDRIRRYLSEGPSSEVIAVDDGSTDQTTHVVAQAAENWPALRLLVNDRNRGKGFSVRRGVVEARGRYVLFTDSDLSAPIDQADTLIAAVESTGADSAGVQKLGQPVPDSNFVAELNRGAPQQTQV